MRFSLSCVKNFGCYNIFEMGERLGKRLDNYVMEVAAVGPSILNVVRVPEDEVELSNVQYNMLAFMHAFALAEQKPPTTREIKKFLGISTTSIISYHRNQLDVKGFIKIGDKRKSRGDTLLKVPDTKDFPHFIVKDSS